MNANRTIFRALLKGTAVAWLIALGTPLRADPYLRQPIDVEHYRFALTLTDSSDRILGEAQIRLKLLAGGMTQVALDLADARDARNGRGMHVTTVTLDGQPLTFRHIDARRVVQLPGSRLAGAVITLEIQYGGIPADGPAKASSRSVEPV